MVVACGLVVHGGEQPVALIGLGLPEETRLITVVEKLKRTHSCGEVCEESCILVATKEM